MPDRSETENWDVVKKVVAGRHSVRAFLKKEVPNDTIRKILDGANRSPSGGNLQPWHVHVVTGSDKERLEEKLTEAFFDRNYKPEDQYSYYPKIWTKEQSSRRKDAGQKLYDALAIGRRDIVAMRQQKAENLRFFGAPVGLFFTIHQDLEQGSWLDMGMFIANVMTLARGAGLDTCPQASFISYHTVIRQELGFSDDEILVCGLALGYADTEHPVNSFKTERRELAQFATFHDGSQPKVMEELSARIQTNTEKFVDKPALIQNGEAISWCDFGRNVLTACNWIERQSPDGKSIALQMQNSATFLQSFIAGVMAGRAVQVFDPAWPDALVQKITALVKPDLQIGEQTDFTLIDEQDYRLNTEIDLEAPFYTGFTSGSTGEPKGFTRNQRSWLRSFDCDTHEFQLNSTDIVAGLGQFTHSLPLYAVIRALYEGAAAVFYSTFRPNRILSDIDAQKVSIIYAVPTQLQALVNAAAEKTFPNVRLILSSGAKCSEEIKKSLISVFPNARFAEFYGSSELSYVTVAKEEEHPPAGSVGRPLLDVSISILDDDNNSLPVGQVGRVFVESPYRFMGYAGQEEKPEKTAENKGIFVGDTGFLDDRGFLSLTGRADRMILSAARNISPEEVEAQLIKHPEIENVAVLGVPDAKRGEIVVAVIQASDMNLTKAELSQFCGLAVSSYGIPKQYYVIDNWPLTPSGKTDFMTLKDLLIGGALEPMQ